MKEMETGHLVKKQRLCYSRASEEVDKVSEKIDRVTSKEARNGGRERRGEVKGKGGRRRKPSPRAAKGKLFSVTREKRAIFLLKGKNSFNNLMYSKASTFSMEKKCT